MSLLCGSNVNCCGSMGGGGGGWKMTIGFSLPDNQIPHQDGFSGLSTLQSQPIRKPFLCPSPPSLSGLFRFRLCENYLSPESIAWSIEDQAFLQLYGAAPRRPAYPLLSRQQLASLSESSCVSPVKLTDGRGMGEEGVFEVLHTTTRKPGPLLFSQYSLSLPFPQSRSPPETKLLVIHSIEYGTFSVSILTFLVPDNPMS